MIDPPTVRTSDALAWAGVALFVGSLVGKMGFGLIAGIALRSGGLYQDGAGLWHRRTDG